jgi:tetratricopeptide (TPR) repeat protein
VDDLMTREKLDEAIAEAIRLSAQAPEDARPYLRLAEIYRRQGKWELAIGAFKMAHTLPAAPSIVHARLLRLYAQVGAEQAATEELKHIDELVLGGPYERDTFVEIEQVKQPRPAPRFSRTDNKNIQRPPAVIGQHTDEILSELGMKAVDIDALRTAGAIL